MWNTIRHRIWKTFNAEQHIAPLVTLRIAFGALMFLSTLRFISRGWVSQFYVQPRFHFTFYGFDWVKPFNEAGMYYLFTVMLVSALFIALGLFYRQSCVLFFLCFTYVELIDKTYYLNHYYLITLTSFLLIWVPANRYFSLDVWDSPDLIVTHVPGWVINIFKFQMVIVYVFAGLSKCSPDWLLHALPLKIWLPACAYLPLIGTLLVQGWIPYVFSWFGALFDLTICFFLLNKTTRGPAYFMLIVFHLLTAWLFKIGVFPYIMISMTLIFFSERFHLRFIRILYFPLTKLGFDKAPTYAQQHASSFRYQRIVYGILTVYFLIQILLPIRFLFYPGKLLWTEEGYRFSWRVMLMEKAGTAFFYVRNPETGRESEIDNKIFLTRLQEKMMVTQPDMLLQYAHYLKERFKEQGINHPVVRVESYVSLNGSGSRLFIDSTVDLASEKENLCHKKWIMPFAPKEMNQ